MASKSNGSQKERAARIHGNQTNRKTKDRGESRAVFKSVLDNPFEVKWPVVPLNIQNAILARITELMQGVSEFHLARQKQSKVAKRHKRAQKRGKIPGEIVQNTNAMDTDMDQGDSEAGPSTIPAVSPEVLRAVVIGINEVTKRLEEQCSVPGQALSSSSGDLGKEQLGDNENEGIAVDRNERKGGDGDQIQETSASELKESAAPLRSLSSASASVRATIRIVLVCRADIDPPLLVSHIPHLVAACNNATRDPNMRVKLVTLPKGAENTLASVMGLRRAAVLAFDETISKDVSLSTFLSSVDTVIAPWIVCATDLQACSVSKSKTAASAPIPRNPHMLRRRLEPTHIKQLRTTAPKDMRAAKAQRAKGRLEAKAKLKARQGEKKATVNS